MERKIAAYIIVAFIIGAIIGYGASSLTREKPPEGLYPEANIIYVPLVAPPYTIDAKVTGFLTYNPNPTDEYRADVFIKNLKPEHEYEIVLVAHDALGNQENKEPVTKVKSDERGIIRTTVSTKGMGPGPGGMLDRMYQVHIFLVDPSGPEKDNPVGLRNVIVQCKFPMGTGRMLTPEEEAQGMV